VDFIGQGLEPQFEHFRQFKNSFRRPEEPSPVPSTPGSDLSEIHTIPDGRDAEENASEFCPNLGAGARGKRFKPRQCQKTPRYHEETFRAGSAISDLLFIRNGSDTYFELRRLCQTIKLAQSRRPSSRRPETGRSSLNRISAQVAQK